MHRVHSDVLSKREKRALWDEIIQDFLQSSQTQTDYANQNGLRQDHLSYYLQSHRKKQSKQSALVPVELINDKPSDCVHLDYKGLRLSVPLNADTACWQALCQALLTC